MLFCSLFQAHSAFRYVVMGANARRSSQTQNKIIASKTELPVKKLNSAFLCNSVILITLHYIEKRDSQFTSLAKIFDYVRVTLCCNSVYRERVERY